MRRGRRGRPHLLCPPCPPIGRSGGQEAETNLGAETSSGAERGSSRRGKVARALRGRCAGPRSSSGCQAPARRCHGRPAPALRTPSGTEEPGHRSAKGTRSQDRCRQAVLGRGSRHSAKPVSSVRPRGVSTVQCNRLCIPSICLSESYREPKQGRRHCVAHLLGGVRPVRAGRVLQRSTPVLVPFLLRGQVRLPVVLHDTRTLERGAHTVPSRHTAAVPKAPRGRGQRRERPRRASPGRGSGNNPGRPGKRDPGPEGQVSSSSSRHPDLPAGEPGGASQPKPSTDSSPNSPVEPPTGSSSPSKPVPRSSSQTTSGQSPLYSPSSGSPLPSKSRGRLPSSSSSGQPRLQAAVTSNGQPRSQAAVTSNGQPRSQAAVTSNGQPRPQTAVTSSGQPRPQAVVTSSGQPQLALQPSGLEQLISTSSSQGLPAAQTPRNILDELGEQAPKSPEAPGVPGVPGAPEPGAQPPEQPAAQQPTNSASAPELPASCQSESSEGYTSESAAEVTCSWPHLTHGLRCLQHCWRLKHLAC